MAKVILQYTRDYDLFIFKADNRDTDDKGHIERLADSMRRNGFIKSKAISVKRAPNSSKYMVMDGQNRLLAARKAQVAVWYSVDNEITDAMLPDLQIAKKWLPKDYLKHFVVNGNKNYIKLKEVHDMYPSVSITTIVLLMIGGVSADGYRKQFEAGNIKISTYDQALHTLQQAAMLNAAYKNEWLHSRTFLTAFMAIKMAVPEYDHKVMMHKLKYRSEEFIQMLSEEGYIKLFDKIYNYQNRTNKANFAPAIEYLNSKKGEPGRPRKTQE
jgi:hypothetical protein